MPKPTFYELLSGGMTVEQHREKVMLENVKKRQAAKLKGKPKLDVHAGLDLLGMTPGVGIGAEGLIRIEAQRNAPKRATEYVATGFWGETMIKDLHAVSVTSDVS